MPVETPSAGVILVLDTCTESASIALFREGILLKELRLESRTASVYLLGAIHMLLGEHGLVLSELSGLGVVSGPGSFTGVRVGLAAAKGLCEANARPLAAVSRLAVLVDAAQGNVNFAVLGAGRDQVYVREAASGHEWLASVAELESLLAGRLIAVDSPELAMTLAHTRADMRVIKLSAKHAFWVVQQVLAEGGSDLASSDANYVRNEEAIYAKTAAAH